MTAPAATAPDPPDPRGAMPARPGAGPAPMAAGPSAVAPDLTGPVRRDRPRAPAPTARLGVLAAVLGVAILVLPPIGQVTVAGQAIDNRFLLTNLAVFVLAALDLALAPRTRRFTVDRRHPAVMELDRPGTITWTITRTSGRRPARVALADDLAPSLHVTDRRITVSVPPNSAVSASHHLRPTRRGRFTPDEVVLRTFGPARLVARQRRIPLSTTLRVVPPFRRAEEAELSLRRARILEVGIRAARVSGSGTDFDTLRDMTPDDDTRRIDWAATARTGRPVVRVYRAERNQNVLVMLDSSRLMAGRVDDVPRLEHAMDGAMMLAEVATRLGDRFGLAAFDETVHTEIPASHRQGQRGLVAETLYDLEPGLVTANYEAVVAYASGRRQRRALLIIMTDLEPEATKAFLLPHLPLLTRKHLVVVAAVADPQVVAWADEEIDSQEQMFTRAAAVEELRRRRHLAAVLRGLGARVVDEPPDRFAVAVADLYLDLKSTAAL
ncbi:MAG: DUF58 domain-containing protein [Acidimicrobiales bacterium]